MPIQKIISILIADDHTLTGNGIRAILEKASDMEVVGEAQDGGEIKNLVAKLKPEILLLDLKMPDLSPVALEEWVRTNYPETNTLILTAHDRDFYLAGMIDAGAVGYFDKQIREQQLVSAIRRAACGEVLFDEEQLERAQRWREAVGNKWNSLSNREREILILVAEGANNKSISATLSITPKTVEKHLESIYKK